jgi:hypothetical protein
VQDEEPRPDVAPAGGDEGITLLSGGPDGKLCKGGYHAGFPVPVLTGSKPASTTPVPLARSPR